MGMRDMFAVRSAILLVALNLLMSPSAVSASSVVTSGADGVSLSRAAGSWIGELDIAAAPDETNVSRAATRQSRLKAVLEEETDRELEEADLGPIPAPRQRVSHTSITTSSLFIPRTSRLRC
jgi:hypothetical protein